MRDRHEIVVVGAGQGGLGLSRHLCRHGLDHVVLERGRVGNAWRTARWDSFCLVTPNWTITLPGAAYDGPEPDAFMPRDAFVTRLEGWARRFGAPVREGVTVARVVPAPDGFRVETDRGPLFARQVVVATATYQNPRLPVCAADLSPSVTALHAGAYRNPDALPPGGVLVVGAGQTGCQIAEELNAAGRPTWLCVGRSGRLPRRYRGRDCIAWQRDMGWLDRTPDRLDDPAHRFRGDPHLTGGGGGRTLSLHDFRRDGITLLGRLAGIDGTVLHLHDDLAAGLARADAYAADFRTAVDRYVAADGIDAPAPASAEMAGEPVAGDAPPVAPPRLDLAAAGVATVIWATGFDFDFGWLGAPVLDRFGYPVTDRGVTAVPGLHFMGLNWMHKRKSGIVYGVAEDAAHLADRIAARAGNRSGDGGGGPRGG